MTLINVIEKLIGPIKPIGESDTDRIRLQNLKELTDLLNYFILEIDEIATSNKDRQESSMQLIGEHCAKFLDDLGIEE